jgi:histidine triad (HIT) family protein
MINCIACSISKGIEQSHVIYESDDIICFLDHRPITRGHILICPKEHFVDFWDLPENVSRKIFSKAKELSILLKCCFGADGLSMIQNNGEFNELSHFHLHLFPRKKGDGFSWVSSNGSIVSAEDLQEVKDKILSFNLYTRDH